MLNRIVRLFPKKILRLNSRNVLLTRSFVSTCPRLGKTGEDKDWDTDQVIYDEQFPSSLTDIDKSSNITSEWSDDIANIESSVSNIVGRELVTTDPFDLVCSYVNNIHVALDVPYWQSIMIATLGLRLLILPVAIRTMQNGARLAIVQPLVKEKVDEAQANKDNKELHAKLMLEARDIYAQHKVNPVLSLLLPFVQMPLFVSFFFGLQRMQEIYPDYISGGTMWFENLAVADPTYMLPIINGFTFFLVFESNSDLKAKQPQMMIFFRAMAVLMIPITANFQSGVLVYWCTNNILTLIQSNIVRQDAVSRILNIPKPPPTPPASDASKVSILELMKKAAIEAQEKQRAAKEERENKKD